MKRLLTVLLSLAAVHTAFAQTDVRALYNFAKDAATASLVLESWSADGAGDTYAVAGFGLSTSPFFNASTAYVELSRGLNIWHDVPVLNEFSLQAEFNGRLNMENSNFLFGIGWTAPLDRDLVKLEILYKTFNGGAAASFPAQFSLIWRLYDLFGVDGLEFRGQGKVWGEKTSYWYGEETPKNGLTGQVIIWANPQIWYSLNAIYAPHLSVGGEVELSYHWLGCFGFRARPSVGLKLMF